MSRAVDAPGRIVFVSWRDLAHPKAGGSEVVVDRLARELQARGHEVGLVCGGPVGPRAYDVVAAGGQFSQYLRAPVATRRHFGEHDLVVDVVNGMPYFSPWWWGGARLALVHHVHDEQWHHYFPPGVAHVGRALELRLMPRAYRRTNFLTISDSSRLELERIGIDPGRIDVMHSGLEADAFERRVPRSPEPLFVAIARLAPNKRVDLLLQLWERVRPVTGGRLVIIGDGPDRAQLVARAGEGVEFVGRVDDRRKHDLLAEAWVFVHTARQEGWGLVIMEAAAAGTPAVAFDVAGVRDAVVDGRTGVLARGDDDFVASWCALAADHARRAELGARAADRAAGFTWDAAVDSFLVAARRAAGAADGRGTRELAAGHATSAPGALR